MSKFIDTDRLIEKILQLQKEYAQTEVNEDHKAMRAVLGGQCYTLTEVVKIIESLQDEQNGIQATATGKVFTNTDPKLLTVDSDEWQSVLGQFDNGQRVRIILVKEDEK